MTFCVFAFLAIFSFFITDLIHYRKSSLLVQRSSYRCTVSDQLPGSSHRSRCTEPSSSPLICRDVDKPAACTELFHVIHRRGRLFAQ